MPAIPSSSMKRTPVGEECIGRLLRQVNQRVVGLAVGCFARREIESEGSTSGITETMNFTGEPAPRAAKSSLMNPPLWMARPSCLAGWGRFGTREGFHGYRGSRH